MSNSINPVKRAAAGLTRKHSRLSIFAASAATAGVLGAAGFAVGSAPWSQPQATPRRRCTAPRADLWPRGPAAFDAATGAKVQLDDLRSAAIGGSTVPPLTGGQAGRQPAPAKPPRAKHAPASTMPASSCREARSGQAHAAKPKPKPAEPYASTTR